MRHSFTLAFLIGFFAVRAFAEEPDAATLLYAQRLAIGVCATCHGPHGNSEQPKFPILAGQSSNYLAAQLKNFRSQTRGDPDAISYMWGLAGPLSDESITALAQYYSSQKATPARRARSAEISRGRDIYEHGVESEGVPACLACHGPDAHGMADFPRLAGQHAQYVLKQLGSFQSNMRNVAVMHGVARGLRLPEMQAVAAYVESLP
ncbi:MAG TPA: c-type cytochrome [Steroidobacteraceae bacterium]